MKVIAVMPAYGEEPRVLSAVLDVQKVISTVLVVDDGSKDKTAEQARAAGAIVIRHAMNRGQGAALKTGTIAALQRGADVIVHVDADGQHDPNFLPALIQPIVNGEADVVFGSRFLGLDAEGMPLIRRMLLKMGRAFSSLILGVPYKMTDPQSGLRAMNAKAARQIDFRQNGMAHCSEILRLVTRSSLRWKEIPVRIRYTSDTLAKGNRTGDALSIVWHLFLGWFA